MPVFAAVLLVLSWSQGTAVAANPDVVGQFLQESGLDERWEIVVASETMRVNASLRSAFPEANERFFHDFAAYYADEIMQRRPTYEAGVGEIVAARFNEAELAELVTMFRDDNRAEALNASAVGMRYKSAAASLIAEADRLASDTVADAWEVAIRRLVEGVAESATGNPAVSGDR